MFTKLGLQNFKAWGGPHSVNLKPLTLVLGVNSAGKTSLLQPLLLLKQTVESPDRLQSLHLGGQSGDVLDLGTFSDIITGHDRAATLGFRLTFGPVSIGVGSEARTLPSVDYEVDYGVAEDGIPFVQRFAYFADKGAYGGARTEEGEYLLSAPQQSLAARRPGRTYKPERSVGFSADAIAALGASGSDAQDLALALTRELQQIAYLGPLRVKPQRFYPWTGQAPGQLGPSGELAIPALIANLVRGDGEGTKGELVRQVSGWLKRLQIADGVALERDGSHYRVIVTTQGQRANLVDVGFGVSQVIPVVTLALFAPEGSLIILEQPELHLHPLAQAELADLLAEVASARKLQFFIETHSEHLFRRLQSLIAAERLSPEDCALHFVESEGGKATLRLLEVDLYGRVKNWPSHFFGDATGEMERQARQMVSRKKRERSHV